MVALVTGQELAHADDSHRLSHATPNEGNAKVTDPINDILNMDVSEVARPCSITQPPTGHGVFFNMDVFHTHLEQNYAILDIMTYGASLDGPHLPIRRAVVGLHSGRTTVQFLRKPKESRLFTNIHSKVILAYEESNSVSSDVFIGSHNFVGTTLYDLMVQLHDKQADAVREYFESFWRTRPNKLQPRNK
jgi:hypothetical protein